MHFGTGAPMFLSKWLNIQSDSVFVCLRIQAIQMAEMDFVDFCRVVHMAYEFMTGKETTLNEMLEHHIKTKYIRAQTPIFIQNQWMERDNEKIFGGVRAHNAYSQEKLEQDCIRSGDVEGLKHALDIPLGENWASWQRPGSF